MVNDIFDPNEVKDGKEYQKLSGEEAHYEKAKNFGYSVGGDDE